MDKEAISRIKEWLASTDVQWAEAGMALDYIAELEAQSLNRSSNVIDWDAKKRACGNCMFWPLGGYQHDFSGAMPLGISGPHTDGTVSDCRAHAPKDQRVDHRLYGSALWPTTRRDEWCGDFKLRSDDAETPTV